MAAQKGLSSAPLSAHQGNCGDCRSWLVIFVGEIEVGRRAASTCARHIAPQWRRVAKVQPEARLISSRPGDLAGKLTAADFQSDLHAWQKVAASQLRTGKGQILDQHGS